MKTRLIIEKEADTVNIIMDGEWPDDYRESMIELTSIMNMAISQLNGTKDMCRKALEDRLAELLGGKQ